MFKRGVLLFVFVFLILAKDSYGGFCDLSNWRIYDDTGAVTYGGATIGGYRFDISSEVLGNGIKRTFIRNDFSDATNFDVTPEEIRTFAENFISSNYQKFGIYSYYNPIIFSTSSSSVDILFNTDILVDPNTCEGIGVLNGDILMYFDNYGNLLGLDVRFFLTFESSGSSGVPATNFSNSYYPGGAGAGSGGTGGGEGAVGGAPLKDKISQEQNPQVINSDQSNYQTPSGEKPKDKYKFYGASYVVPILPVFLLLLFTTLLFFLIKPKKHSKI